MKTNKHVDGNTSSVPTYSGHFRGDMGDDFIMPFFQSRSLQLFSLVYILSNSSFR